MFRSISKISALLVALRVTTAVHAAPSLFETEFLRRDGLGDLGISDGCQNTIQGLLSAPASNCLNLPGTIAIFSTVANSSWIPPINTWLSDFCGKPDCTPAELTPTLNTVLEGCSADIAQFGVDTSTFVQQVVEYFTLGKSALCLRDSSANNDLCAITTLEKLETALGGQPLTPEVVMQNYHLLLANNYALAKELACTPCVSAAFALVRPAIPQDIIAIVDSFVSDQCGVDFTSLPTGSIAIVTGTAAVEAAAATASSGTSAGFTNMQLNGYASFAMGAAALVFSVL